MSEFEYNHLDKIRNNLIKQIVSLSYDQFNGRPVRDKWSIAQVCHHLVLVEKATAKVINWGLKENNCKKDVDFPIFLEGST